MGSLLTSSVTGAAFPLLVSMQTKTVRDIRQCGIIIIWQQLVVFIVSQHLEAIAHSVGFIVLELIFILCYNVNVPKASLKFSFMLRYMLVCLQI